MMLKPLSICGKIQKNKHENACITCNKCRITTKCGTNVAHYESIPHTYENSEIFTDVIDNDVIVLKFEHFRRKARCISVVCGRNFAKYGRVTN